MAAGTYRENPRFDTAEAIREVGVGKVTSMLMAKGVPGVVERPPIRPPPSPLGPIDATPRSQIVAASPVAGKYETLLDRQSAHEILAQRAGSAAREAERRIVRGILGGLFRAR